MSCFSLLFRVLFENRAKLVDENKGLGWAGPGPGQTAAQSVPKLNGRQEVQRSLCMFCFQKSHNVGAVCSVGPTVFHKLEEKKDYNL